MPAALRSSDTYSVGRFRLSYVLPFRSSGEEDLDELTSYLEWLSARAELIIVDGSAPLAFQEHHACWKTLALHIPPRIDLQYANGKVNGVITGVERATCDKVIVADDDVRYDEGSMMRVEQLLEEADLVRPQNYFEKLPWHALWDSGRTLLNRSVGLDYPGTLGVRRSSFLWAGGYDGDVLFENLEMIRTIEATGGVSASPLDLYVARLPPESSRFWQQRMRQAYDDLAQPLRMALFLSIGPAACTALRPGRKRYLALGLVTTVALAERGRRRGGGRRIWPPLASLVAPAWVAERAICEWLALGYRLFRGGVPYRGSRLKVAAHNKQAIRSRLERRLESSRL